MKKRIKTKNFKIKRTRKLRGTNKRTKTRIFKIK